MASQSSTGRTLLMAMIAAASLTTAEAQTAAPESENTIEEIVVTAQKRQENIQEAPAAITAFTGDSLQRLGVDDLVSLEKVVPGLTVRPEGGVSQIFLRGVGSNVDTPNLEGGVAYNLNGIFLPRYASGASAFFDLERVEVLPGPQGTLYGGASGGGVINLFPKKPAPGNGGEVTLEAGNYGLAHIVVAQNVEINDKLSLRGAVDYERHDGYESNNLDSDKRLTARISALFNPNEDWTVFLWAQSFHDGGLSEATVNSPYLNPGRPWQVVSVGPLAGNPVDASSARKGYNNDVIGGQIDWRFGDYSLTYIPGYVHIYNDEKFYAGYLPALLPVHELEYSNELRLANGNDNRLQWLVGLYSLTNDQDYAFNFFDSQAYNVPLSDNKGYAVFGQATYKITDALRATLGGRYSYDSKEAAGFVTGEAFDANYHWVHGDWKVGLQYDVSEHSMLYATVQTGYVPGGYSQLVNTPTQSNEVAPEKLRSYTLGTKNTLLSQRLLVNDELYYYDYSNYQVVAVSAATGISTVFNAQNAKIYGDQLNVTYLVTNALQLDVGANAMSAYFRTLELPGGISYAGYQLANAPPVMLDLGGQYKFGPFDFGSVTFGVHTHHEAGRWAQFDHFDDTYQKAYYKTDVDATFRPHDANWSVALWARNLENVPVFGGSAGGGQPGPASVFLEPPRTFGIRFTDNW